MTIQIDANALLQALSNQRNTAMDDAARQFAVAQVLAAEIETLKKRIAELEPQPVQQPEDRNREDQSTHPGSLPGRPNPGKRQ